jgi:light-regulated signal transduction histidine kinase (bacteriophytochrome)
VTCKCDSVSQNARANCPIHGMFASRAMPSAYDADQAAWRARVEALEKRLPEVEKHLSDVIDTLVALEKRVEQLERANNALLTAMMRDARHGR